MSLSFRSLVLVAVASPLVATSAFPQTLSRDPTLRLTAPAPARGGSFTVEVHSAHRDRPFSLRALSPSGSPFEIQSGMTDAAGRATVGLTLLDHATLTGIDIALRVEVEGRSDDRSHASPWAHLRVDSGEIVDRAGFTLHDALTPSIAILADAGEFSDVDGDGDLDVVTVFAGTGGSDVGLLRVLINDGSGGLVEESGSRIPSDAQVPASEIVFADVNGDGAEDFFVAAASPDDGNALYLNDGSGHFTRVAGFPPKSVEGALANAAVFGDFNGDGHLDLFIANGVPGGHELEPIPQPNELLLNDGLGNLVVSEEFSRDEISNPPTLSRGVAVGDLDEDGNLDLVVGNSGENLLLFGNGHGEFARRPQNWPTAGDSTYGVACEDVDLDGDLDIVYANTVFNPFAQAILLNQGGVQAGALGEFEVAQFPMPVEGQSPVRLGLLTCDVDADGDVDVLFPVHEFGGGEHPDLYLNQGGIQGGTTGTFVLDTSFESLVGVYRDLAFGDLDGDGDGDLLFPVSSTFDPESNPPRTHVLLSDVFEAPNAPLAFLRGDSNGDAKHDVSDVSFLLSHLFLGTEAPGCLAAADVNGTDDVDLSDGVSLLFHLFLGGPPPTPPYPGFGDSPTEMILGCDRVSVFE